MLYDLSVIEMMGDNDSSFINTLLQIFIESIPQDLEALNHAHQKKNWEQVSFMAHKMKSTIDNLSVESLKINIRTLEGKNLIQTLSEQEIDTHIAEVNTILNQVLEGLKEQFPG
jgi:HPt (histidine-containing phosphotransfer) domain-containing protein